MAKEKKILIARHHLTLFRDIFERENNCKEFKMISGINFQVSNEL